MQALTQRGQRTSSLPVGIKQRRSARLRGQGSGEKASLVWEPPWFSWGGVCAHARGSIHAEGKNPAVACVCAHTRALLGGAGER